jgi:DNA-binding NtrC family response regulator
MRANQLTLEHLLEFEPTGGVLSFAGERVVLMDAVALGLLRKQLVESFGLSGARGILTRFGYSHGWRLADAMQGAIAWEDEREWRVAGGRLHRLLGMVTFEPVTLKEQTSPTPFAEAVWPDSFEAEQHLLHHGKADECVCWSLTGFASGYLSRVNGRTIYCLETACRGKGDPVCRMVGRYEDDWDAATRPFFAFYERDCLSEAMKELASSLKKVDQRLSARRRELEKLSDDASGLVVRSEPMKTLVSQARRVAQVDATVLLTGESGSGKERIARLIHESSRRQGGPFVAINCAAVPENLIESELFGHARGAFTGAVSERVGLFEAARGGTLLLDEVGELPLPMQAKLLRVLQEREVRRVGENKTRPIDVRLVAATHRDLSAEVKAGRFREDLSFRLKVVTLHVPPLRERPEDVIPLAKVALLEATSRAKLPPKELSAAVSRALLEYRWPGNVRELFNAMERAAVLAERRTLQPEDLPPEVLAPTPAPVNDGVGQTLEAIERGAILSTLAAERGNRAKTAQRLGIGPATLFRKLKQYQAEGYEVVPANG